MKTLLPLLMALGVAGIANAQTTAHEPTVTAHPTARQDTAHADALGTIDTNGDHLISRDEAAARPALAKNFDAIDTNHDGELSRDELRAWHRDHRQQRETRRAGRVDSAFARADANGDGKLSAAEAARSNFPALVNHFDVIDANHDGFVTRSELDAFMAAHHGEHRHADQAPPTASAE